MNLAPIFVWSLLLITLNVRAADTGVTLTHVHGLSYSADGRRIMIPSHHGLAVFEAGKWSKAPGPQHDYMGFVATATSLYSSGHPAPGSGLPDPLGLMRSADGGKSWASLGLQGETDFHVLAASWSAKAVYVWNPAPSSRMRRQGLHHTIDDGFTWKEAAALGLRSPPQALAVHSEKGSIVAAATAEGVYLSTDSGQRFKPMATDTRGLSVFFDLDGEHLWYSTFDGRPHLARVPLAGGSPASVPLPTLDRDAVAYIAQNPARRSEYSIATFERSIYLSVDTGRTWTAIAIGGATQ